eukprot:835039-Lingulodinium_polyedra.AAC.1
MSAAATFHHPWASGGRAVGRPNHGATAVVYRATDRGGVGEEGDVEESDEEDEVPASANPVE